MEVKLNSIKKISYDFSENVKSPKELQEGLKNKSFSKVVPVPKTPTQKNVKKTTSKKKVVKSKVSSSVE